MSESILREATASDAAGIASVHAISSEDAYAPLAGEWSAPTIERRTAMWHASLEGGAERVLVAEVAGTMVGFVSGGHARRARVVADVELHVIHVLPAHRGRGIGAALWERACGILRGPELASMYVDTLAELRSCGFYAARGGQVIEHRPTDFHGAIRTHVTYLWNRGTSSAASALPDRPC